MRSQGQQAAHESTRMLSLTKAPVGELDKLLGRYEGEPAACNGFLVSSANIPSSLAISANDLGIWVFRVSIQT